ncbi:hypothetical protein F5876DRAFT_83695 [Lentinula aff. lateritia]|uniref:Uncharacterized protein n=1 Tax=Lentinula aff. lateritia TaxID=2804960 RepID=A0ACC1THH1_9AGAR|nr:hypothetical protein F5876DRAFT_83695 [Lentinula aff. lateritia]
MAALVVLRNRPSSSIGTRKRQQKHIWTIEILSTTWGTTLQQWRVITDVFQSQRLKDSSKDISCYSAFTSLQMQILNANTPEGQPRQKVNQLSHIIAEKWRGMTEEERVAAMEDEIVVLHERRENKELGMWHNTDISATHDSSMTVSHVKEELTRLAARTGDECILVVTQGSLLRFHPSETYCSSEKSESFLSMRLQGV